MVVAHKSAEARPVDEPTSTQLKNAEDVILSFIGAIPYTNLTLSELRAERLDKYQTADRYSGGSRK